MKTTFSSKTIFGHFDGNCFFVSCFLVTRPELRGSPVGVLTPGDSNFVSASPELKKLGIKTGTPLFEVREIIKNNNVKLFSSEFETFCFFSERMFRAVKMRTPKVVPYSIDEGYFIAPQIPQLDLLNFGLNLKAHAYDYSRIPICVGFGPTKLLANIANTWAKTNPELKGVYVINEFNIDYTLEQTPISDIWGIGKNSEIKLKKLGVFNALQFRDYPYPAHIQKILTVNGRKLQLELQGVVCWPLETPFEKKKEIGHSRTFPKGTRNREAIKRSIASFVSEAAEEMRSQGSVCNEISLYLTTDRHRLDLPQYANGVSRRLSSYTCDTVKLIEEAFLIFEEIFLEDFDYRKAGIRLTRLQDFSEHQFALFGSNDTHERIKLMKTMDALNSNYGDKTIQSAACGTQSEVEGRVSHLRPPPQFTRWWAVPKITKTINDAKGVKNLPRLL